MKSLIRLKSFIRYLAAAACFGFAAQAAAEIIFYELNEFRGQSFVVNRPVADFFNFGFNDRAASVSVRNGTWQVCSDAEYRGQCATLGPGDYATLSTYGLNQKISSVRPVEPVAGAPSPAPGPGRGRIVLYDYPGFGGRGMTVDGDVVNLDQLGYNDRASSAIVEQGSWQLCEDSEFRGSCMTIEPGRYPNLGDLAGRVSSVRLVANRPVVRGGPPGPPPGRAVLYAQRGFAGRALAVDRAVVRNLQDFNFNDRGQSLRVESGYWMFCSEANFEGECRTFGPGEYAVLPPELSNRISSARRISSQYPYRERPNWGG
ncbi:MAG: beta/gamma crystallin family protein [Pseudomonadota bacterium]|nr:beta/gamma crystallin family protein [Pseudomonadota bacterium]